MAKLKVVLMGGGTGLSVLARGLKALPLDITAIVTVADDGGSTGVIRDEMKIPAPGDVRNVLAALSDVEPDLERLFQYRFSEGKISNHSVGNILIAAMNELSDNFGDAIEKLSTILNVKGTVLPSTNTSPILSALHEDGTVVVGESNIPLNNSRIDRVFLTPMTIKPVDDALQSIKDADLIILGPGSLYTSVIPNIIVRGISEAIRNSDAIVAYVCNIMTQKGETEGYSVSDHIEAIHEHANESIVDYVIANTKPITERISSIYKETGATIVDCDEEKLRQLGVDLITHDELIKINEELAVRHNNEVIAQLLYDLVLQESSTIQYKK